LWLSTADRLAGVGVEHLVAALAPRSSELCWSSSPRQRTDDRVRDMVEVLTGMCARLCGLRGARNGAMRVVTATKGDSVDEVPV
jgi:putative resolvase